MSVHVWRVEKLAEKTFPEGGLTDYHGFQNHLQSTAYAIDFFIKEYRKQLFSFYGDKTELVIASLRFSAYLHDIALYNEISKQIITKLQKICPKDHEQRSIEIAKKMLPRKYHPYIEEIIAVTKIDVNKLIHDQKLVQSLPKNPSLIQKIMADADLYTLSLPFPQAFCQNSMSLKNETKNQKSLKEWCASQYLVFSQHSFQLPIAKLGWGRQVNANAQIFKMLSEMKDDAVIMQYLNEKYKLEHGKDYLHNLSSEAAFAG